MQTDFTYINSYAIHLSAYNSPAEICQFFKKHNIEYYVYEIHYCGIVLKYGMSMQKGAERIYREIANVPYGWIGVSARSPSGKDFLEVCEDFEHRYRVAINKNNILIVIHNMTSYKFTVSDRPGLDVKRLEAELIDAYKQLHGSSPIGNIKDEASAIQINVTPDVVLDKFFIRN